MPGNRSTELVLVRTALLRQNTANCMGGTSGIVLPAWWGACVCCAVVVGRTIGVQQLYDTAKKQCFGLTV